MKSILLHRKSPNHLRVSLDPLGIQSTKLLAILAITQVPCLFCTRYLNIVWSGPLKFSQELQASWSYFSHRLLFYINELQLQTSGLEYAYTTAPRSFQGIVLGLYSAIEGLGSFLGVLLVQITRSLQLGWIRSEVHFNQGHLDYFFYLLAVIQSAVVIISGLTMYLRLANLSLFINAIDWK